MVLQIEAKFGLALTQQMELYVDAFIPSMTPISLQIFGKKVPSCSIVRSLFYLLMSVYRSNKATEAHGTC